MDHEKEFDDIEVMRKEEAVQEIKTFFKGNRKFIDQATLLVQSTHHFEKINRIIFQKDYLNWEKFMFISINTKVGFKQLVYRKGRLTKNEIHELNTTIYYSETGEKEKYSTPLK